MATQKLPDDIRNVIQQQGSSKQQEQVSNVVKKEKKKKKGFRNWKLRTKIILGLLLLILVIAGITFGRTVSVLSKITDSDTSIAKQLFQVFGGAELEQTDGITNIALLGMRGRDKDGLPLPGGSTLTDTIIVLRINSETNQIAMISIPRDLYVTIPESSNKAKINAIYGIGEQDKKETGRETTVSVLEEVTGLDIHYAATADFYAFTSLIDELGGIEITLEKPFYEPTQFEGEDQEGFSLPAGTQTIDGETALFFVRARYASSDFDRAKRQQEVLVAVKDKALANNSLKDLNGMLSILGDNVTTSLTLTEMKALATVLQENPNPEIIDLIFDTSKDGLLESSRSSEGSYILLPKNGSYDEINKKCQTIFDNTTATN